VDKTESAVLGFTVKSGWAAVVFARVSEASLDVIDSCRIALSDPQLPESRQPYHAGTGTVRANGPELSRLIASVERCGSRSVTTLIDRYQRAGHRPLGIAIVVGSLIDPATIANGHIRIHALEGQLFRRVIEEGAVQRQLPCSIWRERDLYAVAERVLHQQQSELRRVLKACGGTTKGPWRAEQKAAALAAWVALASQTI
jgi:hypothetical protein